MTETLTIPESLFPLADHTMLWLSLTVIIALSLAIDLGVIQRRSHVSSLRESLISTFVWISIAFAFNALLFFGIRYGLIVPSGVPEALREEVAEYFGITFFTAYVLEKALSADNIFIFYVIFQTFDIAAKYQHRVLFYGILGAVLFRGVFIFLGTELVHLTAVEIGLGVLLFWTGLKAISFKEADIRPAEGKTFQFLQKYLPISQISNHGHFFVRENGKLHCSMLFVALCVIEVTDVVFALDSIPAVLAVTHDPFLVFSSNIFAILGLRALYFVVAALVQQFVYLKYGLALILMFLGIKMGILNPFFPGVLPVLLSLWIVLAILGLSLAGSIIHYRLQRPVLPQSEQDDQ